AARRQPPRGCGVAAAVISRQSSVDGPATQQPATSYQMMVLPRLNAIVDADAAARVGLGPVDLARVFLDGGARFLQLRAKHRSGAAFLDAATAIVAIGHAAQAIVIVNDRADIAKIAGADGVHVGQDDLTPAAARAILGDQAIVGLSMHTVEQIE